MPTTRYPNALYALLKVRSLAVSENAGHSILPLGPRLRHPGGLRIATVGLADGHGTGTFALSGVSAVPIAIAVSQPETPADLPELELLTTLRHTGRGIMVTSMEAFRSGDRFDRLAFCTLAWSVLPPSPNKPSTHDWPTSATGSLLDVAGITTDGAVSCIETAGADLLGPGGILHAGALQALAEEAALAAARHGRPADPPPNHRSEAPPPPGSARRAVHCPGGLPRWRRYRGHRLRRGWCRAAALDCTCKVMPGIPR